MKVLVTGVKGQLGYDIVEECAKRNIEAVGVDIEEMDITNRNEVHKAITSNTFDAVIHCAAWTAVDAAEEQVEACTKVNVDGTKNIADVCEELDIPMMYFSTDYVFDGTGTTPWKEYDKRDPLNVYGQTKYEGELVVEKLKKHFIIRIAWVFGYNGNNFIKTMIRLGKERGEVSVVNDQIGSPTYTFDLAKLAVDMILTDKFGTYHATNQGFCSWYEFAKEIFSQAKLDVIVHPVDSTAFPVKATRPKNSRMDQTELEKNGFSRLPSWQDAVRRYLEVL
ncbi:MULTISPECIES: dTDP-4-dehydrorhamnose reductase [unclassified Breznakia]|uniref:dTDP-4-dehydrorhamnose reductase n=1 Tax=unclassified Breznakia TaxID=2623764 RepID=UPI0024748E04|nr:MULTISPECIES: dTDP-4-dehydrorhamnose reductase [unclassified Breznakia]MDH6367893.1 dTDP-4-dehydrorhamnose reductase [Breznakia sp. PH1-1]MDH6404981.1 dTDP-4-dehydrorhamnose reductase [Breznakia sp. PF1-11]MDH6412708.1 dTDP-4-dehydrorhamnose reductase [Breznakia sp. PFB1-11]MDH6415056.1 dTDP-4-dehydrorhamnose reductase [Breznakia sp. PFB1-14]MDH6417367.1 dTDP-4-dehydrorhamnose reductase [Breznakia sp. PFB1-4]